MTSRFADTYPAFALAVGAVSGAVAVDYPWAWVVPAVILPVMIMRRKGVVSILLFLCVAFATWKIGGIMTADRLAPECYDGREHTWHGTVASVRYSDRSQRCVVSFDAPWSLRTQLLVGDVYPLLREGDIVEVSGVAEPVIKYDPVPSLRTYIDRSECVQALMYTSGDACTITGTDDSVWYRLQHMRHSLADAIYNSRLDASTSRLLAASILGGGDVEQDRKEAFRSSGLSHLLCVSGFHVGVFAMVVLILLFPMRAGERTGRWRYAVVSIAVWVYALLTGLQPAVFRAAIMLTVYNLSHLLSRNSPPFNSLCVSVVVILLVNPLWVFSIGFQLSVLAVLGLLVYARAINPVPYKMRGLYYIAGVVAVPLSVAIATVPAMLWHFHSLPTMMVPANVLAASIYPVFMISGSVLVALNYIGIPADRCAGFVDWLRSIIDKICELGGGDTVVRVDASVYLIISLSVAAVMLAWFLHSGIRWQRIVAMAGIVVAVVAVFFEPDRAYADDVVCYGNAFSSRLCMRSAGGGLVVPLSGFVPNHADVYLDNYFRDGGVTTDSVLLADDSLRCASRGLTDGLLIHSNGTIFIAVHDSMDYRGPANTLVLKSKYRGCLDTLIARHHPEAVVLPPDMKERRQTLYDSTARAARLRVCRLATDVYCSSTASGATPRGSVK